MGLITTGSIQPQITQICIPFNFSQFKIGNVTEFSDSLRGDKFCATLNNPQFVQAKAHGSNWNTICINARVYILVSPAMPINTKV